MCQAIQDTKGLQKYRSMHRSLSSGRNQFYYWFHFHCYSFPSLTPFFISIWHLSSKTIPRFCSWSSHSGVLYANSDQHCFPFLFPSLYNSFDLFYSSVGGCCKSQQISIRDMILERFASAAIKNR